MKTTKRTFLSHTKWAEIKAKYQLGERVTDIAKEYEIGKSTISQRARRHSWGDHGSLKDEIAREVTDETKDKLKANYKEVVQQHSDDYEFVRKLIMKLAVAINTVF